MTGPNAQNRKPLALGDTTCSEFPTPADRIDMARAAYEEYAEADNTPLEDFVLDVEMLARAEGLEQKIWVVLEHEPSCGWPVVIREVFATEDDAQQFVELLKQDAPDDYPDKLWWGIHERVVRGPGVNLARLV